MGEGGDQASDKVGSTRPPRFQFGLKTLLILTTGLAAFLSLACWQSGIGTAIGVIAVCTWWAWLACRSGYRRLAYYLVGFLVGAVLAALMAPLFGGWTIERGPISWWEVAELLMFCCFTCTTSGVLRKWIRSPRNNRLMAAYLAAPYLVLLQSAVALGIADALQRSLVLSKIVYLPLGLFIICLIVAVGGTLTLPFTGFLSILLCCLLRQVDPNEEAWLNEDSRLKKLDADILLSIDRLVEEGRPSIKCPDIAHHLNRDLNTIANRVWVLCHRRVLRWMPDDEIRRR